MVNKENVCRICANIKGSTRYVFKEKQFGTDEPFVYFECASCGCLQIAEIPEDMAHFYPTDYASHRLVPASKFSSFRRFFKMHFLNHAMGRFDLIGAMQGVLFTTPPVIKWLAGSNTGPDSSILDIGCGMGNLLAKLWQTGIRQLVGIDPFIPNDVDYTENLSIYRLPIEKWSGSYDLVISNHSFEHVPNPTIFMASMRDFLAPGGTLLIRIPLMGKYSWREFGENWAQLDAPRHLFLHTEKSMEYLADLAGMEIYKTIYDSQPRQIANSIKFQKGLNYEDSNREIFSKSERNDFKRQAKKLNASGDGDQAIFFLRSKS